MSRRKKLQVALPLKAIDGAGARGIDPPRLPEQASPVVGALVAGGLPGGALCLNGR